MNEYGYSDYVIIGNPEATMHAYSSERESQAGTALRVMQDVKTEVDKLSEHHGLEPRAFTHEFRQAASSIGVRTDQHGDIPERTITAAQKSKSTTKPIDPLNRLYRAKDREEILGMKNRGVFDRYDDISSALLRVYFAGGAEVTKFGGERILAQKLKDLLEVQRKYKVLATDVVNEVEKALGNL